MRRRRILAALALLPLSGALAFNVKPLDDYRRHHLFILAPAEDPAGQALAKRIAQVLAERLPESRAQTLPVAETARLAEFLVSRQFDVAVMRTAAAEAAGADLRALYAADDHLLVCRSDFLDKDAARIAEALGPGTRATTIPFHPGVTPVSGK